MLEPLLKHEQHGHHHQGHVTMPRGPLSGLILRHANMAFGILEGALDPETLGLHARELSDTCLGWGVAQAVLESARGLNFPPDNQMPTVRSRTLLVPQPDPLVQHFNDQVALGRVSQSLLTPARYRLFLHPLA